MASAIRVLRGIRYLLPEPTLAIFLLSSMLKQYMVLADSNARYGNLLPDVNLQSGICGALYRQIDIAAHRP